MVKMLRSVSPADVLLPTDFHMFAGERVPDPITFVVGEDWLASSNLYPRQATLLKVIFLREDLFTEYDYEVVAEWEESFRHTGNNGITPGILQRMRWLRSMGYPWFREVLLVLGRRAGKGYVSALAMAYVLWNYLALGDPQGHFGVDRDKQLACFIYAGKKEQATKNLWGDLNNVIKGGPCFGKYISRALGESISVYAPNDFLRMRKLRQRGIFSAKDAATFLIEPKEATLMSGRGPASFMQGYDEMAHVVATGANRSAEEVYGAATPALDQFKKYAFIVEPSSPWQQIGQFYSNWQKSLAMEDGKPLYPEMMMLQLTSWDMYVDWEDAHLLPLFPEGFLGDLGEYESAPLPTLSPLKVAIQEYDEHMQRLEKANPDTFKVERRSHWQATVDAYLNPEKVEQMFAPYGPDNRTLTMQDSGLLSVFFKGHADPSLANANFALAIGHPETDENGTIHLIFDYIHHFQPSDFPDNVIDYPHLGEHVWKLIQGFKPDEFTYDQWNSAETIQRLSKRVREANFPKRVQVYEVTATNAHNWERAENFKIALNQGWIHAPYYEQAELELKFLQLKNGKVVKQETGPVQTKDVADCLMEVAWTILGTQVHALTHRALSDLSIRPAAQGGFDPHQRQYGEEAAVLGQLSSPSGRGRDYVTRGGGRNPARNPYANRRRR